MLQITGAIASGASAPRLLTKYIAMHDVDPATAAAAEILTSGRTR